MTMLLAIDIGNTNVTLGVFERGKLKCHSRLETEVCQDHCEVAQLLKHFFQSEGIDFKKVDGVAISSVVPSLNQDFSDLSRDFFGQKPLWITPSSAKIPLRVDTPDEVGADRLCNAVAAWEKFKQATIVVDFGTATTFDIITAKGEYGGGAIIPGLQVAADALAAKTAQLPKVEIAKPKRVVGRNTVECIQAGLYYGYVGMIDHLIDLSRKEEGVPMKVIATGGLAPLIAQESKFIEEVEPFLTLEGICYIWIASPP